MTARHWRLSYTRFRDATLFLTGLGLLVHELVIRNGPERPTVLLLLAGILGVPAFLRVDEKRNTTPDEPREVNT